MPAGVAGCIAAPPPAAASRRCAVAGRVAPILVDLLPKWEHDGRVRIIAWSALAGFAEGHRETAVTLARWRTLVRSANWTSMDHVRRAAPSATVLNAERVKFEIAGGNYRLVIAVDFDKQIVFVRFIGTHGEYDKIDALTVSRF